MLRLSYSAPYDEGHLALGVGHLQPDGHARFGAQRPLLALKVGPAVPANPTGALELRLSMIQA